MPAPKSVGVTMIRRRPLLPGVWRVGSGGETGRRCWLLPEPMLDRAERLPRGDYGYEVKWDGFRAPVSTEAELVVRSRRGWAMSERLPELTSLPSGLLLDGELVAFGPDGRPSFQLLGARLLHGRPGPAVG
jgi:ATP-dependent DNA ligase